MTLRAKFKKNQMQCPNQEVNIKEFTKEKMMVQIMLIMILMFKKNYKI